MTPKGGNSIRINRRSRKRNKKIRDRIRRGRRIRGGFRETRRGRERKEGKKRKRKKTYCRRYSRFIEKEKDNN